MRPRFLIASVALLLASAHCLAQGVITPRRHPRPQPRVEERKDRTPTPTTGQEEDTAAAAIPSTLPVTSITIRLKIVGQVAVVRVEHQFRNDTDQELEGTYFFPVPEGASLLEFAVYDGDEGRVGRVKEKQEARAAYSSAVGQGEDPALLEMTK